MPLRSGPASRSTRHLVSALLGMLACLPAWPQVSPPLPTTFGTIVGNALLCRDDIDNRYYYDYLVKAVGPSYKHDGGAWWFKTDSATLWGIQVKELMVSDDTSALVFAGALLDATPEKLEQAIIDQVGVHYAKIDSSAYPVREARPGSRIVYADTKAKMYCAKFKALPPGPPPSPSTKQQLQPVLPLSR